jgi:hypothetical protein
MTIEIHRPELEALIAEWMNTGEFPTVEDALMQALKSSARRAGPNGIPVATGADLVAAMQASPYKEVEFEPLRARMPVRDAGL